MEYNRADFTETQELLKDIRVAEAELDRGEFITYDELKAQVEAERKLIRKELGL